MVQNRRLGPGRAMLGFWGPKVRRYPPKLPTKRPKTKTSLGLDTFFGTVLEEHLDSLRVFVLYSFGLVGLKLLESYVVEKRLKPFFC